MPPVDLKQIVSQIHELGERKWLTEALTAAFIEARKGKLKTYDEHTFEVNWMQNLTNLRDTILERSYEPGASVAFVIFDPMVREIFAAPFRDRVVHHFLYKHQGGWWDRRFIYDSYSCREGKGTLFGIQRAQQMMRAVTQGGTQRAWTAKMDIKGYFMHLSRQKLYDRVRWGMDRQFVPVIDTPEGQWLFWLSDFLWQQVLYDDPVLKAWKRGPAENWNPAILPENKSLFKQPHGQGIVIGNLTSQLVSNIFLDQLDRFVKYDLGYKYYGRYVDDFFVMVSEAQYPQLKRDVTRIEEFLTELGLVLHDKKRSFQQVSKGMNFLGARVHAGGLYPSDRLQRNFCEAVKEVCWGVRGLDSIVSYLGLMKHLDAQKFIDGVL